ncbi:hypothetical protein [Algiphilus sp.]|uniref:hypothetical protein n=1 Tax=Algiphilus sp. TaxID=1872431 RepID=UPI0025B7CF79|nr:hypothetical protein [Algiphilus sp.]MCK5770838.1 hypothetical protein [Algiphilus sp.]
MNMLRRIAVYGLARSLRLPWWLWAVLLVLTVMSSQAQAQLQCGPNEAPVSAGAGCCNSGMTVPDQEIGLVPPQGLSVHQVQEFFSGRSYTDTNFSSGSSTASVVYSPTGSGWAGNNYVGNWDIERIRKPSSGLPDTTTAGTFGTTMVCEPIPQCEQPAGTPMSYYSTDGGSACESGCVVEFAEYGLSIVGETTDPIAQYISTGETCGTEDPPHDGDELLGGEECVTSASGKEVCAGDALMPKNCGTVNGDLVCIDTSPGCGEVNGQEVCEDDLPEADNCATNSSGDRICITDDGELDHPENEADEEEKLEKVDENGNRVPGSTTAHIMGTDTDPGEDECDPQTEQCDDEPGDGQCDPEVEQCDDEPGDGECDPETEECGEGQCDPEVETCGGTFVGKALSSKTFSQSTSDFMTGVKGTPLGVAISEVEANLPDEGTCPAPTVDLTDWNMGSYTLDAHCILLEEWRSQIRISMLAFYSLLGIFVFLRRS